MNFDIVGAIHGHSDSLITLLKLMGYLKQDEVWKHPERSAMFLGHFIDRGPNSIHANHIKTRNPSAKYTIPITPAIIPRYQSCCFLIRLAIDDNRMAICKKITATPKALECN